jgi:hypothetical protein
MPLNKVSGRQARIHCTCILISHRAVTECGLWRRFCLFSPVQYRIPLTSHDILYIIIHAAYYVTHPHWWIFSGGSALNHRVLAEVTTRHSTQQATQSSPESDRSPGSFSATDRYGWLGRLPGRRVVVRIDRYLQPPAGVPMYPTAPTRCPDAGGPSGMGAHVDFATLQSTSNSK